MAYAYPANENDEWKTYILDSAMHLTHNFDFKASNNEKQSGLYVAGKEGVKLYVKKDAGGTQWQSHWIDNNGMACEDIQVMDLNGDGKPDIVAAGRASHNLKIYWNISGK
ncbi:MAG TPA: VCBS repeat-containing protein [Agriterribacter sp.]|nr:VCBS repeat-containing protein [Agriterribacter sp.]HRQ49916.1 VCBS repeat-containing protein [Agriterribacter sp.]